MARLWFYSFSQKTPYFFSLLFFSCHPTMRCSHWLTYSLEGILSHFISFHFISHLFFCSHPTFCSPFDFLLFRSFSFIWRIRVLYACVCISTRVFLTITLLILFYIFLLDFFSCCITSKMWTYCCEFWSLQSKSSSVVRYTAHIICFFSFFSVIPLGTGIHAVDMLKRHWVYREYYVSHSRLMECRVINTTTMGKNEAQIHSKKKEFRRTLWHNREHKWFLWSLLK